MNTEYIITGLFAAIIVGAILGYFKIRKDERDGKA